MIRFGSGISSAATAASAAREAATDARATFGDRTVKLALVFASTAYADLAEIPGALHSVLGPIPIAGGTSGACVFGTESVVQRGISVVLLGGDALEVTCRSTAFSSADLVEVVPVAEEIAAAADAAARRGFDHYACLVFAASMAVDGETLVTAVRKGAGARAQLAGAFLGNDLGTGNDVFVHDELRSDRVCLIGLYSKLPIGIAARHGLEPLGKAHTVTRTDGMFLVELDGRPALDVWLEDARAGGGMPPACREDIPLYLAKHFELGLVQPRRSSASPSRELVARAPVALRSDGAIHMRAALPEGAQVHVMSTAERGRAIQAAADGATAAAHAVGDNVAGALVLSCACRLASLADDFPREIAQIRRQTGAPIGGACVYGEIARNVSDADAFFNSTAVVVTFGG